MGFGIGEAKTMSSAGANAVTREHLRMVLRNTPGVLGPLLPPLRPAAVFVPVVERAEPTLLFTRRTDHLSSHAGQVCFPGGRFHADDETLVQTALREMEEEIGLSSKFVEIAGYLDFYETLNSRFMILPVVGFVKDDFLLTVNTEEVAEVFEAPLSYIIDPKNHVFKSVERDGVVREFFAIEYQNYTIWGATAAMIVNLSERLGLR